MRRAMPFLLMEKCNTTYFDDYKYYPCIIHTDNRSERYRVKGKPFISKRTFVQGKA